MQDIPAQTSLCVALSGGLDSVVLLHALHQLNNFLRIRAIHINHGLSTNANRWQQQCEAICQQLKTPLTVVRVDVEAAMAEHGEGLENSARNLRYEAFESLVNEDEILLLAHHLDDQLETLLLRLMRGAGLKGLAAIPARRVLGKGELYRPLLHAQKTELMEYGRHLGLQWSDDESNQDSQFDRNFCRNEVLPLLEKRWPGYRSAWSKSLQLIGEGDELTDTLGGIDLEEAKTEAETVLDLRLLQALSKARRKNCLRFWLRKVGIGEPGWTKLETLVNELGRDDVGNRVLLETKRYQLVSHEGFLHLLRASVALLNPDQEWQLDADSAYALANNGKLQLEPGGTLLVDRAKIQRLQIRYREGGEHLKLPGRPNKSLKKLFQESTIKPWLRQQVPLLFAGEDLVFVPGVGAAEAYAVADNSSTGWTIVWTPQADDWSERS